MIAQHFGEPMLSTFETLWLVLVPFILCALAGALIRKGKR